VRLACAYFLLLHYLAMLLEFDPAKRDATLAERGLDFADAAIVFAGKHRSVIDDRASYGEVRWITVGTIGNRLVVLVWTQRGPARRIISLRKANEREKAIYLPLLAGG
jgi:uncharacterized DUF497 family protein